MREKSKRQNRAAGGSTPRPAVVVEPPTDDDPPEQHVQSPTAVAAEAMSRGVPPPTTSLPQEPEIPRDEGLLRVGDVDADPVQNAFVGDEAPGGDMPTPDQDLVDEIGRAYGVQEADSGALRTSAELLDARDRHRAELDAPRPPHGTRDEDRERNR